MNAEGRFRHWIDPFDRWHAFLLPPILIVLLLLLWILPQPRSPQPLRSGPPNAPTPAHPVQGTQAASPEGTSPAALRQMRPTRIESPFPNALFWRDRLGDVEGVAEPGSTVRLMLGEKLLSVGTADSEGRYRFRLANFPPGRHQLQIVATLGDAYQPSEPVQFTVKAEKSPPPPKTSKGSKPAQAPAAKPPAKKPAAKKP